jgi:probable rRNA maturation factor
MKGPTSANGRTVEVVVDRVTRPRWFRRLPSFCARVLEEAGASSWEVTVLLCDDSRMKELNARYRGIHRTTDVLSFPRAAARRAPIPRALEGRPVAGDIAISLPTMRRNAKQYGNPAGEELKRLLVHGILHLAGMDHGSGKGRGMLALQGKLLAAAEKSWIIREGLSGE